MSMTVTPSAAAVPAADRAAREAAARLVTPEGLRAAMATVRDEILARHRQGESARTLVHAYASSVDSILVRLLECLVRDTEQARGVSAPALALVAVGGYGRGELNIASDIDAMVLYRNALDPFVETVSQRFFYLLTDARLPIGFSARSVADCVAITRDDFSSRAALVDARFLWGDATLYREFERAVFRDLLSPGAARFVAEKIHAARERRTKFGGSIYTLEPNVKQGDGGLRDIHTARWIGLIRFKARSLDDLVQKGIVRPRDARTLARSHEFLLRVRNHLHAVTGHAEDHLTFDHQEEVARFLGFKDSPHLLAVERFMQTYYRHATNVRHFLDRLAEQAAPGPRPRALPKAQDLAPGFKRYGSLVYAATPRVFADDPTRLITVFALAQEHGLSISAPTKELIRTHVGLIDRAVRRAPAATHAFLSLLERGRGTYETLHLMNDLRVLGRYLPEFRRIFCRVQYNPYHAYTVDAHSLFLVRELAAMIAGDARDELPLATHVMTTVRRPALAVLAGLLHDVGKGRGPGHEAIGAAMARTVAERLALSPGDTALLSFLIEHHLLLSHLALKRDLSDERIVLHLARTVPDLEALTLLYLVTVADIRAVAPGSWTSWKGDLLAELYRRAVALVARGEIRGARMEERLAEIRAAVDADLALAMDGPARAEHLAAITARHLLAFPPASLATQVLLVASLMDQPLVWEAAPDQEATRLTVVTRDRVGLFAQITGVLAAHRITILTASIHTRRDGIVVDVFRVHDLSGEPPASPARWREIMEALADVITGRQDVRAMVGERSGPLPSRRRTTPGFTPRVLLDTEISESATVIDLYASDRIGLLYDVAQTLTDLGVNIEVSLVETKGAHAEDVFYVTDQAHRKITDPALLTRMRESLLAVLGGGADR